MNLHVVGLRVYARNVKCEKKKGRNCRPLHAQLHLHEMIMSPNTTATPSPTALPAPG